MAKRGLAWLVAAAVVAVIVLVALVVPTSAPEPVSGTLPLPVGALSLPNPGSYYPACSRTMLRTWWAVYVLNVTETNVTVQVTGAWRSTFGTRVFVGDLADAVDLSALATWFVFSHCPPGPPPETNATAPPLPVNGTLNESVFIWPSAHRVFVQFISFTDADTVFVVQRIVVSAPG